MTKTASCSVCRRILRVALLVFAFLAPPTFAGVVTLYARARSADALEPLAAEPAAMPPRPPAAERPLAENVAGTRPSPSCSVSCCSA